MNLYKETKMILDKYNIKASKKLGQNFLIDENTVNGIVEKADIKKEDLIIEIGPGLGTLTKELVERAGKVICIELDTRMITILKERFSLYNNIDIINEDVLKVDLKNLIEEQKETNNLKTAKIVANLPYYITTPIIMKLLEEKLDLEQITVMVQKEVAVRLVSEPGKSDTGAITYAIHYYTEPEILLNVGNDCFVPSPEVESAVINLKLRKVPCVNVKDEEVFFKVIKVAFSQRRKTLLNTLTNSNLFGNKEEIENILNELRIPTNIRGEKLTLEEFARISDKFQERK